VGGLKTRAPGWHAAGYALARGGGLRAALADDGPALRRRAHAPRRVPRRRERGDGRRRAPRLRRQRVPEIPPLRGVGPRLRARTLRGLRLRAAGALLLQGARGLSELRGTASGRARGAPGRSRAAGQRAHPPVGTLGPAPAA